MTKRYYVPASSEEGARAVVDGIDLGRIPCLPEYTDADLAAENLARYPRGYRAGLRLWCIERRAVDDGRITIVRVIDSLGELAASIAVVIGGCFAVGWGTLL